MHPQRAWWTLQQLEERESVLIYPRVFSFYTVRDQEDLWSDWRSVQQAGAFIKRLHLLRLTRPPAKSNRLSIIHWWEAWCTPTDWIWTIFCTMHYSVMSLFMYYFLYVYSQTAKRKISHKFTFYFHINKNKYHIFMFSAKRHHRHPTDHQSNQYAITHNLI